MNPLKTLEHNLAAEARADARYLAVVVDNDDPKRMQRVQVTIPGMLEAEDKTLLPWFQRATEVSSGGMGDNYGDVKIPRIGARVWVTLQQGDVTFGFYSADAITSHYTLHAELEAGYPNRVGGVNAVGDLFYVDLKEKTAKYVHHSGTSLLIADDGSVTLIAAKNLTEVVKGDYVMQVDGKASVTVNGSNTVTTKGAYTDNRQGGSTVNVTGNAKWAVTGKITTTCSSHTHVGKFRNAGEVTANGIPLSSHSHPKTGGPLA